MGVPPRFSLLQIQSALKYRHTGVQRGLRHRSLLQGDVRHRGGVGCARPPPHAGEGSSHGTVTG